MSQGDVSIAIDKCATLTCKIEKNQRGVSDDYLNRFARALNMSARIFELINIHRSHPLCNDELSLRFLLDDDLDVSRFADLANMDADNIEEALSEIKQDAIRRKAAADRARAD